MKINLCELLSKKILWSGDLDLSEMSDQHDFAENNFDILQDAVFAKYEEKKLYLMLSDGPCPVYRRAVYFQCNEDVYTALEHVYSAVAWHRSKIFQKLGT